MDSKLGREIVEGIEGMRVIEAFLVFSVAAFDLAVMSGRIGTNQLVTDTETGSGFLKERGKISFAVRETVGEFKTVVGLDAVHMNAPTGIPGSHFSEEIRRGVCRLLRVSRKEAQTGKFINGSVLKQPQIGIGNTLAGYNLNIHLYAFTGISHLLIGLRLVSIFGFGGRKHIEFSHDAEKALRTASVTALFKPVPKLDQTEIRVAPAHITDEFEFVLCMLIGVTVRSAGLAGKGRHTTVPARFPKVDVGAAFVVLPACPADTVFFRIFH